MKLICGACRQPVSNEIHDAIIVPNILIRCPKCLPMREKSEFTIGEFTLCRGTRVRVKKGSLWIEVNGGEGMETSEAALEKLLQGYWKDNF